MSSARWPSSRTAPISSAWSRSRSRRKPSQPSPQPCLSEASPVEPERALDGGVGIWLDHATVAKLKAARGPGESYSDVILALAEAHAGR